MAVEVCHDTIVCIVTGAWTGQGESRYKLYCSWGSGLVGRNTVRDLAARRVVRQATTRTDKRATHLLTTFLVIWIKTPNANS